MSDALLKVDDTIVAELATFSTPSILNGLKRLGVDSGALQSFDRQVVRCISPQLGVRVGFAVTRTVATRRSGRPADAARTAELTRRGDADISALPGPRFLVVENVGDWRGPVCIWGEVMAYINVASGIRAGITNGPVRDVPEMEAAGFAAFAGGVAVGGGHVDLVAVSQPVAVGGVVVNGHVDTVDPATGRKIRPPLISMRATREKFDELVLTEPRFDPVASIKRHFFAAISLHPEKLQAVEPVMPFSRADPRVIEAIDVISTLDQRPNLLDLSPKEFESFVQNLFTKMGYETDQFRSSGDGGIDCMAYKRDPVAPMKIAVQAKLYTKTVHPTHVRDLYGTMQHEGATLGIMITTSGYGPGSEEFANGKPLHLIDGTGLLSICQEHDIPARILGLGRRKPRS